MITQKLTLTHKPKKRNIKIVQKKFIKFRDDYPHNPETIINWENSNSLLEDIMNIIRNESLDETDYNHVGEV